MKKTLLVLITLIFSLGLSAQTKSKEADIAQGQVRKIIKNEIAYKIISHEKDGFIIYKASRKGFKKGLMSLETIDKNLKSIKINSIDLSYNKKKRTYETFLSIKGKLFLFTSFLNKKTKMNYLFVQSVNKKTLTLNSDVQKIAEINYKGNSKYNSGAFNVICSNDSSKILVYHNLPFVKKTNEKFGLKVFDNNMKALWKKDIAIPYLVKLFDVEDFAIDNKGEAYILGELWKEKKLEIKGKVNSKYVLLTYSKSNNVVKTDITLGEKFIAKLALKDHPNGNIICAGFFSNANYYNVAGACFFIFDGKTKKLINTQKKEFGIDFIVDGLNKRKQERKKKKDSKGKTIELNHYEEINDILVRKDGSLVLIAEQEWVETYTTTDSQGRTRTRYVYHNGDILVVSALANGNIEWSKKVIKSQASSNAPGYYMSYASALSNGNLYFVFNDNPDNLTFSNELYHGGRHFIVPLVKLDRKGNKTKEILFKDTNMPKILVDYNVSKQVSNKELLLYLRKNRKTDMFIKLDFKK